MTLVSRFLGGDLSLKSEVQYINDQHESNPDNEYSIYRNDAQKGETNTSSSSIDPINDINIAERTLQMNILRIQAEDEQFERRLRIEADHNERKMRMDIEKQKADDDAYERKLKIDANSIERKLKTEADALERKLKIEADEKQRQIDIKQSALAYTKAIKDTLVHIRDDRPLDDRMMMTITTNILSTLTIDDSNDNDTCVPKMLSIQAILHLKQANPPYANNPDGVSCSTFGMIVKDTFKQRNIIIPDMKQETISGSGVQISAKMYPIEYADMIHDLYRTYINWK